MSTITTNEVYHRPSFKPKSVMKKEYSELVKFCDQLLISEHEKDKQILELKQQNMKLAIAVDILNQNLHINNTKKL
jgi:hypothetical protein